MVDDCNEEMDDERMLRPNASEVEAVMVGLPAAKDDPLTDDMTDNPEFEQGSYRFGICGVVVVLFSRIAQSIY